MRAAVAASTFGTGRRGAGWRAVVWLLLLSFTLQSYITQTHMHVAAFSAGPAVNTVKNAGGHDQSPLDRASSDCPFCQAVARAGAFFTPAPPILVLPALWVEVTAQLASAGVAQRAFAHAWQSRAPPQH